MEITLRIFESGVAFFKSGWNWIQFVIQISCFIELTSSGTNRNNESDLLRLMRIMKCILFLRCIQYFPFSKTIVNALNDNKMQYFILMIFLTILTFIYSSLGMQLFYNEFDQNDQQGQLFSFQTVS